MKIFVLLPLLLFPLVVQAEEGGNALKEIQAFIATQTGEGKIDKSSGGWRTHLPKFPPVEFAEGGHYQWTLKTSEGTLTAELDQQAAPDHVRNILYLTSLGFYDGLIFHRIIPGFMAQGGCPLGKGYGNPGYTVKLEVKPDVLKKMEAAGNPNPYSNGVPPLKKVTIEQATVKWVEDKPSQP